MISAIPVCLEIEHFIAMMNAYTMRLTTPAYFSAQLNSVTQADFLRGTRCLLPAPCLFK